ncbi:MAG TPA: hypothetical protein VJ851_03600 [Jatrophihabitans sp.]|nr:hypothetical protein [Jatrophihabitans sp.]
MSELDPWHPLDFRLTRRLRAAGLASVSEVITLNARELAALPGIGSGTLTRITTALAGSGLALAEDSYAPYECAREAEPARDAELRGYFLCDECSNAYQTLAFSGRPPEWRSGEVISGYCGHCNELKDVRLTQWYLCGVCDRVIRSIGRSLASVRYVEARWAQAFDKSSGLVLIENDPAELRPRGKRSDATRVAKADFRAMRESATILGLELKSGRSPLPGGGIGGSMGQFQLDTTDCDDMCAAAVELAAPIFLLHAQVIGRAYPPTERYEGVGLWFARPWDLLPNLAAIRRRPRETRDAAYFKTTAFRPFDEFPGYMASQFSTDLERMTEEGYPQLYVR